MHRFWALTGVCIIKISTVIPLITNVERGAGEEPEEAFSSRIPLEVESQKPILIWKSLFSFQQIPPLHLDKSNMPITNTQAPEGALWAGIVMIFVPG